MANLSRLGLDKPVAWDGPRGGITARDDDDSGNPADDVVDEATAIDVIEPKETTDSDISKLADEFTKALVWASQAKSLVEMGWRIHAMISLFRPALLEGIEFENSKQLKSDLRSAIGIKKKLIYDIGENYRGVFAWCRRCSSLSQLGQRGFAMLYVMRRDLIGKLNTNAALGGLSNKTRQAFNKTVQDFRDSNHGFRNGQMRGEPTRIRCRRAQTSRN